MLHWRVNATSRLAGFAAHLLCRPAAALAYRATSFPQPNERSVATLFPVGATDLGGAGGQPGGMCHRPSMATTVLGSTPVWRSISCCGVPMRSKVWNVTRKCDFNAPAPFLSFILGARTTSRLERSRRINHGYRCSGGGIRDGHGWGNSGGRRGAAEAMSVQRRHIDPRALRSRSLATGGRCTVELTGGWSRPICRSVDRRVRRSGLVAGSPMPLAAWLKCPTAYRRHACDRPTLAPRVW